MTRMRDAYVSEPQRGPRRRPQAEGYSEDCESSAVRSKKSSARGSKSIDCENLQKRASRAFSARFDDRKSFAASNNRSRNFERSETTPASLEKRRFPNGARRERSAVRAGDHFEKFASEAHGAERRKAKEEFADNGSTTSRDQDGAYAFSGRDKPNTSSALSKDIYTFMLEILPAIKKFPEVTRELLH